jgi:hypothetical protein
MVIRRQHHWLWLASVFVSAAAAVAFTAAFRLAAALTAASFSIATATFALAPPAFALAASAFTPAAFALAPAALKSDLHQYVLLRQSRHLR